jgi:ADP-ribose pyrophosphatase
VSEPFTIVDTRRVFDGKVASVRVDRVRMPKGTVAAREVVEHDRAVAVVALDDDDRVVLVEQYRHPFRRRLWELPAGLMDVADEPPLITAQRELLEEAGIAAASWAVLVDIASSPGFTDEAVRIFLARKLSDAGRPPGTDDEESDLRIVRVSLDDAVAAVFAGTIVNSSAVAGLLATHGALHRDLELRPADDGWSTGPAVTRAEGESAFAPLLPGVAQRADSEDSGPDGSRSEGTDAEHPDAEVVAG